MTGAKPDHGAVYLGDRGNRVATALQATQSGNYVLRGSWIPELTQEYREARRVLSGGGSDSDLGHYVRTVMGCELSP